MADESLQLEYFEKWYAQYPRKTSKGNAKKAWIKATKGMNEEELKAFHWTAEQAIISQKKYADKKKQKGDWAPDWKHPATWLNGECWDDILEDMDGKPAEKRDCTCACGAEGRTYIHGKPTCWTCREKKLRNTEQEPWQEQMVREYCREHGIHKWTYEQMAKFRKRREL